MDTHAYIREFIDDKNTFLKKLEAHEFYEYLRNNIDQIQKRYARGVIDIIDGFSTEAIIKKLGNKIETLPLVDENDGYYRNLDGFWASEFRQDCVNYRILPESRERTIFCRITLFIIEDMNGNILVSRRSSYKSHPNMLEIP